MWLGNANSWFHYPTFQWIAELYTAVQIGLIGFPKHSWTFIVPKCIKEIQQLMQNFTKPTFIPIESRPSLVLAYWCMLWVLAGFFPFVTQIHWKKYFMTKFKKHIFSRFLPYLISNSHFTDAFYQGFKIVVESWYQHRNSNVGLHNSAKLKFIE